MVGQYLRSKREELSLTLKEISKKTRIRVSYLQAIEAEDFDKIPGNVYIKGYVRQYCRALSIPEDEALDILREDIKNYFKPPEPQPLEKEKKTIPLKILYPVAVIIIVALIGFYFNSKDKNTSLITQKQITTRNTTQNSQDRLVKNNITNIDNEDSSNTNIKIPSPLGTAEADYAGKHILEVETLKETWIFINIDNKLKYSMILKPGEVRSWSGKKSFFMRVGNAGGIRITYDGQSLGSPGRMGEVVSLTLPDELERFKPNAKEQE